MSYIISAVNDPINSIDGCGYREVYNKVFNDPINVGVSRLQDKNKLTWDVYASSLMILADQTIKEKW